MSVLSLTPAIVCWAAMSGAPPVDVPALLSRLVPQPQRLELQKGQFPFRGTHLAVTVPTGPNYGGCRAVLGHAAGGTPLLPWPTRDSALRRNQEIQRIWCCGARVKTSEVLETSEV